MNNHRTNRTGNSSQTNSSHQEDEHAPYPWRTARRSGRKRQPAAANQQSSAGLLDGILSDPVQLQELRQLLGGAEPVDEGDDDWMRWVREQAVNFAIKHQSATTLEEMEFAAWGLFCDEFHMRPGGLPLWAVHVCEGKASQALVLSQLNYWMPRARKKIGGLKFVVKSRSELSLETGLSEKAIQTALKALTEEKCFLEKRKMSWKGRTTNAFRVEYLNVRNSFLQLDVMKQDACRGPAS